MFDNTDITVHILRQSIRQTVQRLNHAIDTQDKIRIGIEAHRLRNMRQSIKRLCFPSNIHPLSPGFFTDQHVSMSDI